MEWIKNTLYLSLKNSPAAVLLVDSRHIIRFANDNASQFIGLSSDKLIGTKIHPYLHPSKINRHLSSRCPVLSPLKTGENLIRLPDIFYDINHQPRWVDFTSIPVIENGKITALLLSWVPASLLQRTQDSMQELGEIYKAAFDSSVDGIIVVDKNGTITNANSSALHFFDESSLVGKNLLKLFPKTHRPPVVSFWESMLQHQIYNSNLTLVNTDNTQTYVQATGKSNIQSDRHLIIFHNITNEILAQRRRDEFAAIISHEVKNPLAVIKAFTQLLERRLKDYPDPRVAEYLRKVDDKVNFVAILIANLTDTIRLGTGQLSFRDETIEFDTFIQSIVNELQRTYPSHKIQLSGKSNAKISIDRHRLNQVVSNLLNNAVKYSPESNKIDLYLDKKDDFIQFKVVDYGIGIDIKNKKHLFQPFTRLVESAQSFPGLGLGLYLTKSILSHYNGKINVSSSPGKGSTFTIRLPSSMP